MVHRAAPAERVAPATRDVVWLDVAKGPESRPLGFG